MPPFTIVPHLKQITLEVDHTDASNDYGDFGDFTITGNNYTICIWLKKLDLNGCWLKI